MCCYVTNFDLISSTFFFLTSESNGKENYDNTKSVIKIPTGECHSISSPIAKNKNERTNERSKQFCCTLGMVCCVCGVEFIFFFKVVKVSLVLFSPRRWFARIFILNGIWIRGSKTQTIFNLLHCFFFINQLLQLEFSKIERTNDK